MQIASIQIPIRLLHLDDNPLDTELVRRKLRAAGLSCDMTWVTDKQSFESALRHGGFDVILCDYSVPGYSGKAALKASLATQPLVPVIMISGALGDIEAVECLKAGATDYLLKHQLERLPPAIKRALCEAEDQRERIAAEAALRVNEEKTSSAQRRTRTKNREPYRRVGAGERDGGSGQPRKEHVSRNHES